MGSTIIYLAAFVTLTAVAVATTIVAVRRNGRDVDDLINQLIIWVGIAALLPLSAWAGATMLHPRVRLTELTEQRNRFQQKPTTPRTRPPAPSRAVPVPRSERSGGDSGARRCQRPHDRDAAGLPGLPPSGRATLGA